MSVGATGANTYQTTSPGSGLAQGEEPQLYSPEILLSAFFSSRFTTPAAASATNSLTLVSRTMATILSFFKTSSGSMMVIGLVGSGWAVLLLGWAPASGSGVVVILAGTPRDPWH